MTTLVVGASGETGRLLVEQLLNRGESVRIIVRSDANLPEAIRNHPGLSITQASITEMSDTDLAQLVTDCDAVASCLGHTLSFKGVYGQ
ncbi:MAG: NAD(P)H-binding protein, partial [Amphritea sp.]|nr:NAD(P)H-binding protein [Amphritea sp.]MBQ0783927.1 NAD(P)H-binding protein [Amphritea sp.]